MLHKGRKREAKGVAVLYFFIGLLVLLIILVAIYFALVELDYSDQIADPEASIRAYVETTPTPAAADNSVIAGSTLENSYAPASVDLTEPTATPTPEPTATATPTPTPTPTLTPTYIPRSLYAEARTSGFTVPDTASDNGAIGITECYVSQPDGNSVMRLAGYGYVNDPSFDGSQARTYVVVTQRSSNRMVAYQATNVAGASNLPHTDALCQNATACDFELYIDVSQYTQDIYSLALVIGYRTEGSDRNTYAYYPFSGDISFTVVDGQVVTPVTTVDYE